MKNKEPHRGSFDNPGDFAKEFILARMDGFKKDMKICLTSIASPSRSGRTHAYFPALAACFGTLDYLTALRFGLVNEVGWEDVIEFAEKYLRQPDYRSDTMTVFREVFRNPVAHRGIASGVLVDRWDPKRRMTWRVLANAKRPSIDIRKEEGWLINDPPWPCRYTHRVHIHLKSLEIDICKGAEKYAEEVVSNSELQCTFSHAMEMLYPD